MRKSTDMTENLTLKSSLQRLTPREERFVREYAQCGNAKRSAIQAGYSARSGKQIGHALLKKPRVQQALERLHSARSQDKPDLTPGRAVEMLLEETADPNPKIRLSAKRAVAQAVGALGPRQPQQENGVCPDCAKTAFLKRLSADDKSLFVAGTSRELLAHMNQEQFEAWARWFRAEAEERIELARRIYAEIRQKGPRPASTGGSPGLK